MVSNLNDGNHYGFYTVQLYWILYKKQYQKANCHSGKKMYMSLNNTNIIILFIDITELEGAKQWLKALVY